MPVRHRPGPHELGQNFLTDAAVVRAVVQLVSRGSEPLVEWAAGNGALTMPLSALGRPLEAVEVDVRRVARLRRAVGPHVSITEGDILRHAPPAGHYDLVCNVPFHITTPVMRRLLRLPGWQHAVLITQWEVARKRAGVGGATQLTAQWWPWFDFSLQRRIPATSFTPRPSVDAGLLLIERRARPLVDDLVDYQRWVRGLFTGRGRGLLQVLVRSGGVPLKAAAAWCQEQGLTSRALPRDLRAEQWASAYRLAHQGGASVSVARRTPPRTGGRNGARRPLRSPGPSALCRSPAGFGPGRSTAAAVAAGLDAAAMDMHAGQLTVTVSTVRELVDRQFREWRGLAVRAVRSQGTVNALFRLGETYVARLPLVPREVDATRRWLVSEARAARELSGRTRYPTPEPVALGEPGAGYPLPWSVQTWLPGTTATAEDPGKSSAFAHDLAEFIHDVRAIETRGRTFRGPGRGGHLPDHDGWMQTCFERSERLLDVAPLRRLWADLRDLPRHPGGDVMTHGDLIPGNVLVADARLAGVIDVGGLGPADPALDLVAAWHLLEAGPRQALRDDLHCDDLEWARGVAWALEQAMGAVWYYADSNPTMSLMGRRTLQRILADESGVP